MSNSARSVMPAGIASLSTPGWLLAISARTFAIFAFNLGGIEGSSGCNVLPTGTNTIVGLRRLPPAKALPGISFLKSSLSAVTAKTAASKPLG